MTELPDNWWKDPDLLKQEVEKHGGFQPCSNAHSRKPSDYTLRTWWGRHGLPARVPEYHLRGGSQGKVTPGRTMGPRATELKQTSRLDDAQHDDQWLLDALKQAKGEPTVAELADAADVSPRRVREAAARLQEAGYRVGISDDDEVVLTKIVPEAGRTFSVSPELFDGDWLRVGVVSDTHLGANEEALEELHTAYEIFDREGITEVWHAGDFGTGLEMFRTHHAEARVHTAVEQVDYLVDNYPRLKSGRTRGISGNHDLEGAFGRMGFDPVAALAARRDDIDYLGEYGAWLELRDGTGSYVHLLHGSGGMSYAYSYKAQKLVDGYPGGRKPNVLIPGHWHVRGDFNARNVHVLFPGCFEWQSRFMQRLGLQPAVGFHILELCVADDGSIVRWKPEWFQFFAGRKVAAAA